MYEIAVLEEKYFRVFQGAYNDFRLKARTDYKFEIDPLIYDDFIDLVAVNNDVKESLMQLDLL